MTDLKALSIEELTEFVNELGEPAFRAKQLFSWVHEKCECDFEKMSNLSKKLIERLKDESFVSCHQIKKVQTSRDGTKKFLLELFDGNLVECVLMKYEYGLSVCISTQIGCAMGCVFCASGMNGLVRNLTAGEIVEEIYAIRRFAEERIGRIVFMGMGEPLTNYENVLGAIRILCDEKGQNLSPRHVTISTCGIVPGIKKLANEGLPLTLALSLHAAIQSKREAIMPIAKEYSLKEVMDACNFYRNKTGRRITYEYCIQGGVNDLDEDIEAIFRLLKGQDAHVNIIPVHQVEGLGSKSSSQIESFKKKLEKKGINVTIRRELGQDIDGACGQLRLHSLKGR